MSAKCGQPEGFRGFVPVQVGHILADQTLCSRVLQQLQGCAQECVLHALSLSPLQVPSFTNTKLLWLKRNEPDIWSRVAAVMLPHDYMNYWLTGNQVTEVRECVHA